MIISELTIKKMVQDETGKNLRRCLHFDRCNQNLCPLDLDLHLRSGGEADKCRWMRERKGGAIVFENGLGVERRFRTKGSSQMPDELLKSVPNKNATRLNKISQNRWEEMNTKR
jgi:hypothetical protein